MAASAPSVGSSAITQMLSSMMLGLRWPIIILLASHLTPLLPNLKLVFSSSRKESRLLC